MKPDVAIRNTFPNIGQIDVFKRGVEHLKRSDGTLSKLIDRYGRIEFKTSDDMFESLVESILSQQLASAAASSIIQRVRSIFPAEKILPGDLIRTPVPKLREAGVSPQKISCLKELSAKVHKGELDLEDLRRRPDQEVLETLDPLRGIGPWTVQMLLIFTLGRADVLPVDDLGIRKSVKRAYALRELPERRAIERISRNWHPYCTIASLYLWRGQDGR